MGTRIFNDLDDDDIDMSEFVEPKRFRCAGRDYCGDPSCHRCFPGNTYCEDQEKEDRENV
jgi:hypothetical protein